MAKARIAVILAVVTFVGCNKTSNQSAAANSQPVPQSTGAATPAQLDHVTFRGLRLGQSRAEVETAIKQMNPDATLSCEEPQKDGSVMCSSWSLGPGVALKNVRFTRNDKLQYFAFQMNDHSDQGESFFDTLRTEVATANHRQPTAEAQDSSAIGTFLANQDVQNYTLGTNKTVVCVWDQEKDDCPAEEIRLTEYHHQAMEDIEFRDNEILTEGWVKKDKNRPQPKVQTLMSFLDLRGGESRTQVAAHLQRLHYRPLSCKTDPMNVELQCTSRSGGHEFEQLGFTHGHLSSFQFTYPASEHDALYNSFVEKMGPPTDFAGKQGSELFTWRSEESVPCAADSQKDCPATSLMLGRAGEGETKGSVIFIYAPLMNQAIEENALRMIRTSSRQ
jgi:hypothetical protein